MVRLTSVSKAGGRSFDILIDDEKTAIQTLDRDEPDRFFDAEYRIPVWLTRGKKRVAVKFQAHPAATAGVFLI